MLILVQAPFWNLHDLLNHKKVKSCMCINDIRDPIATSYLNREQIHLFHFQTTSVPHQKKMPFYENSECKDQICLLPVCPFALINGNKISGVIYPNCNTALPAFVWDHCMHMPSRNVSIDTTHFS